MRKVIASSFVALFVAGATLAAGCLGALDDGKTFFDGNNSTGGTAGAAGTTGTAGTGGASNPCAGKPCDLGANCSDSDGKPQDTYCASGHCSHGVCCDSACDGTCEACNMVNTGEADGKCAPAKKDTDPYNSCEKGSGAVCTNTGECDGNGKCALNGCTFANASGSCDGIMCSLGDCTQGFGNCDGDDSTGCEKDITTLDACGDCNTKCAKGDNVAEVECDAAAKACKIKSCAAGFADCDMTYDNGCETDLNTSVDNCGACGRACSGDQVQDKVCAGGVCTSTCMGKAANCEMPMAPAADDGCEVDTDKDVNNCGACGRACSGLNVASKSCTGGICDSTCDLGFANCNKPTAPADDNGCEQASSNTHCGGCLNQCYFQGYVSGGGFVCGADSTCTCGSSDRCKGDGVTPGTCEATGVCSCNGTTCNVGEACKLILAKNVCSCNGAAACAAGQTCCQTPSGCKDLQTDAQSCGACGHACAAGFVCMTGVCGCDGDDDCNAGSAGTCDLGTHICSCGAMTCASGERCQPDGTCG